MKPTEYEIYASIQAEQREAQIEKAKAICEHIYWLIEHGELRKAALILIEKSKEL